MCLPSRRPQLIDQRLMKSRRSCSNMYRIIGRALRPTQPPIRLYVSYPSVVHQLPSFSTLSRILRAHFNQWLDVFDSYHFATRLYELGEDMSKVSGSRSNVQDSSTWLEVWEQRLASCGMHVRGGDGGAVADGLRRVLIRCVGGVVSSIDLLGLSAGHALLDEVGVRLTWLA